MEFVKCSLKGGYSTFSGKKDKLKSKLEAKGGKLFLRAESYCALSKFLGLYDKVLSVSYVKKGYEKTFTERGIIFDTKQKPVLWCPFNTVYLQYYITNILKHSSNPKKLEQKIRKKLFSQEKKVFDKEFPNSATASKKCRNILAGCSDQEVVQKFLAYCRDYEAYNEILFDQDIEITPKAVFWIDMEAKEELCERINDCKEYFIGKPAYNEAIDYFNRRKPISYVSEEDFLSIA